MEITMNKKFELTNESKEYLGVTLYRIRALKDFDGVKIGDLGGFVEKEGNLSQKGDCWIYDNAMVFNDAKVYNRAKIFNDAKVCDNAQIYGDVIIYDHASVFDEAIVCDKATVFGDAAIFGNAVICDDAIVCDCAHVCDDTKICDSAKVRGKANIFDNAIVNKEMDISSGKFTINTLEESIRCQTGLAPCNGEVIAYKRVSKDLNSLYDHKFKYVVGEWAEAKEPNISDKSCASGLHFSNATYWDNQVQIHRTTLLIAKIRLEDIITVQSGKIRCKRAFIMGTYNI